MPHHDLSAIRKFEYDRKPICPSKVMAVKDKVWIIFPRRDIVYRYLLCRKNVTNF